MGTRIPLPALQNISSVVFSRGTKRGSYLLKIVKVFKVRWYTNVIISIIYQCRALELNSLAFFPLVAYFGLCSKVVYYLLKVPCIVTLELLSPIQGQVTLHAPGE